VGDPDQRGSGLGAQLLQLIDDLGLGGDIEGGGRLVGHDQVGLVQHRDRDGDALAHAAGELVRPGAQALLRRRDADARERRGGLVARLRARHRAVRQDGVDHLVADAQQRMQRGHRILEDHRNATAADRAQLALRHGAQVAAAVAHRARHDTGRVDQPEDRIGGDRLAAAGLADDSEGLAFPDLEADIVDRGHDAVLAGESRAQAFHRKHGSALACGAAHVSPRGSFRARSRSPTRLMPTSTSSRISPG
jgi:hypothetical protein